MTRREAATRDVLHYLLAVRCCGDVAEASNFVLAHMLAPADASDSESGAASESGASEPISAALAELVEASKTWHVEQLRSVGISAT